ncbi:substrate-binding periplasmic protein [Spartinivicinus poritis]|uniref:Solute-binding protein family 3/N-terminal domain-containing protein n=1 Tax=Spartinivicinus poritis TaxID=2994640 RepID=A0ABT5U3S8_9GAMM|nr:transporter substrate-binding domain-containing protein [Spartinivicinus sp. A2-2]MDE1460967.1 hypothetical protein [Spartinivicinus sp. A2-2]
MTRLVKLLSILSLFFLKTAFVNADKIQILSEENSLYFVENRSIRGELAELAMITIVYAGFIDYEFDIKPWARVYTMALEKENILVMSMVRSKEREKLFHWVGQVLPLTYGFYKLKFRDDIDIYNLKDAKKFTIGVMRNDVRHQYLVKNGFKNLILNNKYDQNLKMLLANRFDLTPVSNIGVFQFCQSNKTLDCSLLQNAYTLKGFTQGIFMAYSKKTPISIVNKTREAFNEVKKIGIYKAIMSRRLSKFIDSDFRALSN